LSSFIDGRSNETLFDYDAVDQVERIRYPDGTSDAFVHDPVGQLIRMIDRAGTGFDSLYDAAGRITSIRYFGGSSAEFTYDNAGKIIKAVNQSAEVEFTYDSLGRLTSEACNGDTIRYSYNSEGLWASIELPSGDQIRYEYDQDGHLALIADSDGARHSLDYSPAGQLLSHHYPNNLVERYRLSGSGMIMDADLKRLGDSTPVVSRRYRYNADQAVIDRFDSRVGSARYEYDQAGRVRRADYDHAGSSEVIDYDPSGNAAIGAPISACVFDACNRLMASPSMRAQHDRNGNTIQYSSELEHAHLNYNAQGLVTAIETGAGNRVEFVYDAFGRRILKRCNGIETYFLWSGNQMVAESRNGDVVEFITYVYRPGEYTPCAMRIRARASSGARMPVNTGGTYAVHVDHRQAPIRVTDYDGTIVWEADYAAYGEGKIRIERVHMPFRLPGQYFDRETNLHYNRARYYDAHIGRYISPDPLGFAAGLNLYAYANGDPINQIDPFGMSTDDNHNSSNPALAANGVNGRVMGSNPTPTQLVDIPMPPEAPPPPAGIDGCGTAKLLGSMALDFVPVVSNIKSAIEAVTGEDKITGEKLGPLARVVAAIGAIPVVGNVEHIVVDVVKVVGKENKAISAIKLGEHALQAEEKEAINQALQHVDNGTSPPWPGKWGAEYKNKSIPRLPDGTGYMEHYIPKAPGDPTRWGPRRLVIGQDGSAHYTPDHYKTWIQVR